MPKICCLSDQHGFLPTNIPKSDILVIAGDICPVFNHDINFQHRWFNDNFLRWARELIANKIVNYICYIGGNHDFIFEEIGEALARENPDHPMSGHKGIYYLQDSAVTIDGIKFYGLPWQRRFFDWAFNLDEPELAEKYSKIPDDVDVIISHGPAQFYGDAVTPRKWQDEEKWPEVENVGSPSLLKRIDEIQPKLLVVGHIHSGYELLHRRHGSQKRNEETIMVNASYVNEQYKPTNKPWVIEI